MNPDQFIRLKVRNAWVEEPGFSGLYVRFGQRYLDRKVVDNVLDIANVSVENTGAGVFTQLIERLRKDYPTMVIYVENVLSPRFGEGLEKLWFHEGDDQRPCFILHLPGEFQMKIRVMKVNSGLIFTIVGAKPTRSKKVDPKSERLVSKVADMYFDEVEAVLIEHNLPVERFQRSRYNLKHSSGGATVGLEPWGFGHGTFDAPEMGNSGSTPTDGRARMLLAYQAPLDKVQREDKTYQFFKDYEVTDERD